MGSAPRIARHLAFVIPAECRSPPESAGRGAFGNSIGEPTTDHAARYYKFESISLQRRVGCELASWIMVGADGLGSKENVRVFSLMVLAQFVWRVSSARVRAVRQGASSSL